MSEAEKLKPERSELFDGIVPLQLADDEGAKRYPKLFAGLRPLFREGVQTRPAGVVTITVAGSLYKVTMRCPGEGLQATLLLDSLQDLLKKLEAFLASGKASWEVTYDRKKALDKKLDKPV